MTVLQDHLNRSVTVPKDPRRIVSLCPSITERLFDLGLEDRLVGRSRFCIHPREKVALVAKVGGTKTINFECLYSLEPDLIIAEKEENSREIVETIESHYPVFVMDVTSVRTALQMISDLGMITGSESQAGELTTQICNAFQFLKPLPVPRRTLYLIWRNPYMTVGTNTYIHDVISRCGLENACRKLGARYPELSSKAILQLDLELILLPSEPFPFKDRHCPELQSLAPGAELRLVNGEMFSWYGSRTLKSVHYLQGLLDSMV